MALLLVFLLKHVKVIIFSEITYLLLTKKAANKWRL